MSTALRLTKLISAILVFSFLWACTSSTPEQLIPSHTVSRGDFTLSITESGMLQAIRSVTITSDLPSNRAKVIWLIKEGTYVQEGDVLVKFDPTPFKEDIKKFERQIKEAEGVLAQTREDLNLQIVKAEKDEAAMEHALKLAEMELENLIKGKAPLQQEEAKTAMLHAEMDWKQARQDYEDLKEILSGGFVTRNEVERAERQAVQAGSNYEFAKEKGLKKQMAGALNTLNPQKKFFIHEFTRIENIFHYKLIKSLIS
ncbi:MAG: hypothetical protein L3J79_02660 [Candidatus Marinimicrobia bacterium]|nr:hypothetical protein [Candidatus Neomarinimicrobiota bacterium]